MCQVALMSSWAEVTREVCVALGAAEAARAAAHVLDAPHHHHHVPLARARLKTARDILKGPLGEDPGHFTRQFVTTLILYFEFGTFLTHLKYKKTVRKS